MIKEFNKIKPSIGDEVFIAESAVVIGYVEIGNEVNIWFGTVVRGDMHYIKIGDRTNIQDNSIIHVTTDISPTNIGSGVTIGHGAIIHGCTIEDNCLIGMGAIVMDDVIIGRGSLIGAGALIPPGMEVPPKSLVVGGPGKVIREVNQEESKMILERPSEYINLSKQYINDNNTLL